MLSPARCPGAVPAGAFLFLIGCVVSMPASYFLPGACLSERFRMNRKGSYMQADLPFYESPEDALRAAVQALGGAKKVGGMLWPDKGADTAGRHLLDCINPGRAEKLEMTQMMAILRLAKEAGHHAPMTWLAAEIGYDVHPVTRAEEVDRLTTVVEQSTKTLAVALQQLERIQAGKPVSLVRTA